MKQVAFAIFQKEIREVLRDRRTLFLALVLPLIFYPVLLSVTMLVSEDQTKKADRIVVVHQGLPEGFEKEPQYTWKSISSEVFDAGVLPEGAAVGVQYDGSVFRVFRSIGQEASADAVVVGIRKYQDTVVEKKLADAGVDASVLNGSRIEHVTLTLSTKIIKKQLGSAGAYFLIFLAFTGCMAVAVDAGAGERERGTMEAMMATPASFIGVSLGKFMFVLLMGIASVVATFAGMGSMLLFDQKLRAASSALLEPQSLLMLSVLMLSVVIFFASLLFCISLRAKSAREAHLRSSMIMMILAILLIICGSASVSESAWVAWVPVMNVAVLIPKILVGSAFWSELFLPIMSCSGFALTFVLIASVLSRRSPECAFLGE